MSEAKIEELDCDTPEQQRDNQQAAVGSSPVLPTVEAESVASTKNLVPLVQKWIEVGAMKGCFTIDVAYALFISLQMLLAEPHTAIVGNGKLLHSRIQSVANLMVACKTIQAKGKIFSSVEQGAQVYEAIVMLDNIVNREVKITGQDDQSHRHCSEQDLIPTALRLSPQNTLKDLLEHLETITRKGFEMGAIDFEKSQALSVALMLLKRNPGDTVMNAEKTMQIMNRSDAFQILAGVIGDITLKGDLISLNGVVVIWPIIMRLKKHFEEEIKANNPSSVEPCSETNDNHMHNKKRKTEDI